MSEKRKEWFMVLGAVVFTFCIRSIYAFSIGAFAGLPLGGDSGYYMGQAEKILQTGIGFYIENSYMPYYWGYPSFLALLFAFWGENLSVVVIVQILLAACCSVFIYKIIKELSGNLYIAFLLACAYSCILDVILWDGYILSDSMGMIWECLTLYFFYQFYVFRSAKQKDKIFFFICMILFFMTRTNSLSLLLVLAGYIIMKLPQKQKKIIVGSIPIIAVAVIFLLLKSGGDHHYGLQSLLEIFVRYYENGEIVSGRPEYDYVISGQGISAIDVLFMLLLRIKYYWSIYFSAYSMPHKLICCMTILPIFLFSIFSVFGIIKDKKRTYYPLLAGVMAYSIIQIFTEVDFDQRYRAPIFLLLILICSYGAEWFWEKWKK